MPLALSPPSWALGSALTCLSHSIWAAHSSRKSRQEGLGIGRSSTAMCFVRARTTGFDAETFGARRMLSALHVCWLLPSDLTHLGSATLGGAPYVRGACFDIGLDGARRVCSVPHAFLPKFQKHPLRAGAASTHRVAEISGSDRIRPSPSTHQQRSEQLVCAFERSRMFSLPATRTSSDALRTTFPGCIPPLIAVPSARPSLGASRIVPKRPVASKIKPAAQFEPLDRLQSATRIDFERATTSRSDKGKTPSSDFAQILRSDMGETMLVCPETAETMVELTMVDLKRVPPELWASVGGHPPASIELGARTQSPHLRLSVREARPYYAAIRRTLAALQLRLNTPNPTSNGRGALRAPQRKVGQTLQAPNLILELTRSNVWLDSESQGTALGARLELRCTRADPIRSESAPASSPLARTNQAFKPAQSIATTQASTICDSWGLASDSAAQRNRSAQRRRSDASGARTRRAANAAFEGTQRERGWYRTPRTHDVARIRGRRCVCGLRRRPRARVLPAKRAETGGIEQDSGRGAPTLARPGRQAFRQHLLRAAWTERRGVHRTRIPLKCAAPASQPADDALHPARPPPPAFAPSGDSNGAAEPERAAQAFRRKRRSYTAGCERSVRRERSARLVPDAAHARRRARSRTALRVRLAAQRALFATFGTCTAGLVRGGIRTQDARRMWCEGAGQRAPVWAALRRARAGSVIAIVIV
ncbi:hypothetical protein B0H15DRAFT_1024306 [Mycena belliarum]|uniref:Uncharacterized protein n=1 Tax=Mycena belliarum TaxID=1033014 RepID=A0AAD6XJN0_9AGAR|nr:hypothetical protein B0H15DRAFT_1024306 [Mycena belliae]